MFRAYYNPPILRLDRVLELRALTTEISGGGEWKRQLRSNSHKIYEYSGTIAIDPLVWKKVVGFKGSSTP